MALGPRLGPRLGPWTLGLGPRIGMALGPAAGWPLDRPAGGSGRGGAGADPPCPLGQQQGGPLIRVERCVVMFIVELEL